MSKLDAEKQEMLSQIFRSEFSSNQQGIGLEENKLELSSEVPEDTEEEDENDNNDESRSAEELQQLIALQNKIENYIIEKNYPTY